MMMQKNNFSQYLIDFIFSLLLASFVQDAYADISIAAASNNLITPVGFFTEAVYNICYIVAITLFVASIAQYRAYRLSPNQTPLNRPIMLLILAIIVALTPLIAKLSEAEKYTHYN